MNADISDRKSLFGQYLMEFCHDNKLILSGEVLLPADSDTHVSEDTTSWFHHCICTADADGRMEKTAVLPGLATTDHMPISVMLTVESLPALTANDNFSQGGKVERATLTEDALRYYHDLTLKSLGDIETPRDATWYGIINCALMNSGYCVTKLGMV